jgi:hypothetical protein
MAESAIETAWGDQVQSPPSDAPSGRGLLVRAKRVSPYGSWATRSRLTILISLWSRVKRARGGAVRWLSRPLGGSRMVQDRTETAERNIRHQ